MEITVNKQLFTVEGTIDALESFFLRLDEEMAKENLTLGSIDIDGVTNIVDPIGYLQQNLQKVNKVHIVLVGPEKMASNMMRDTAEYLSTAIPHAKMLSDQFYFKLNQQSWVDFASLLEGIQFILTAFSLYSSNVVPAVANSYDEHIRKMSENIHELEIALQEKDHTLMADLLKYEIIPGLENLYKEAELLLKRNGQSQ